jgi:hypothetical protein
MALSGLTDPLCYLSAFGGEADIQGRAASTSSVAFDPDQTFLGRADIIKYGLTLAQINICTSPQTERAWPEIVRPLGEQRNSMASAISCGVTVFFMAT